MSTPYDEIGYPPITTAGEIEWLMLTHPTLCYQGWEAPQLTGERFLELREKLRLAFVPLDLCRRVFRDPRFLKKYRGRYSDYKLKHVVEFWEFDPTPTYPPPIQRHYNGHYVCQGVATAAAILEGFEVKRYSPTSYGSIITVPLQRPGFRPASDVASPGRDVLRKC